MTRAELFKLMELLDKFETEYHIPTELLSDKVYEVWFKARGDE